jgi:hypothetical protein
VNCLHFFLSSLQDGYFRWPVSSPVGPEQYRGTAFLAALNLDNTMMKDDFESAVGDSPGHLDQLFLEGVISVSARKVLPFVVLSSAAHAFHASLFSVLRLQY